MNHQPNSKAQVRYIVTLLLFCLFLAITAFVIGQPVTGRTGETSHNPGQEAATAPAHNAASLQKIEPALQAMMSHPPIYRKTAMRVRIKSSF